MPLSDPLHAINRPDIRCAWRGPAVLITDNSAACGAVHLTGFFFREARHLRDLRFTLNEEEALANSVAEAAPHALESTYLYPPVDHFGGGGSGSGGGGEKSGIPFRALDLRLRHEVLPASLRVTLSVANRSLKPVEFDFAWHLSADYAELATTQLGATPHPEVSVSTEADPTAARVTFRSEEDGLPLETRIEANVAHHWEWSGRRLQTRVGLAPQEMAEFGLRVVAVDRADPVDSDDEARRLDRLHRAFEDLTTVEAPGNPLPLAIINRAIRDVVSMALLDGPAEEWLAPAAGFPLYPALFGRDALTAGWQAAPLDQGSIIRAVLDALGRRQGARIDPERDEQPGRIIQQARRSPLPRVGRNTFDRYYGDYASPLMYVISLAHLYGWSGRLDDVRRHWDTCRRIIDWAQEFGDRDGDGYLEYLTEYRHGPKHQGWKDSDNAVVTAEGEQVEPPVAVCEVQGYYYAALQFMAVFALLLGKRRDARDYWNDAAALKEQFNRDFWMEDEGFVAFGLDNEKRPIRSLTSNAAQCLTTGIVSDEHAPRLVRRLFRADLFSGWGIRTLSAGNPAYNPFSYHLGSVWPVENGTITFGLRRYGYDEEALRLTRAMFDLGELWQLGRIPECVGGLARNELAYPGSYPRANAPQAWNQSTYVILLQAILGLRPVAALNLLAIDPVLPAWLPEVVLRDLRVGPACVTLRFSRDKDGRSHVETLHQEGPLRLVRQPPLDSLSVGVWDRLGALIGDALPF